jgi:hypothetical protein
MEIRIIVRYIVALGILGLLFQICLFFLIPIVQESGQASIFAPALMSTSTWLSAMGVFVAPIVQLVVIVWVLLAAAEKFGFTQEKRDWSGFAALGTSNNVQAFIAVAIIGALVIGVLGGIRGVDTLKDIALVVVGFYFGTRQGRAAIETAVAAGVAAGRQEQQAAPAPSPMAPSPPAPDEPYERTNPVR